MTDLATKVTLAETREFLQRLCDSWDPKPGEASPHALILQETQEDQYACLFMDFGVENGMGMGHCYLYFEGDRLAYGFAADSEDPVASP